MRLVSPSSRTFLRARGLATAPTAAALALATTAATGLELLADLLGSAVLPVLTKAMVLVQGRAPNR